MFKNMMDAINAAKAAFNNNNAQEENTMNENINTTATNNNVAENKEERKMTLRERHEARTAAITAKVLEASNKSGYGVGYGATTVKLEAQGLASKIKDAITGTAVVTEFNNGYADGKDKATEDYVARCKDREEKARAKADNKAAQQAAQELVDQLF